MHTCFILKSGESSARAYNTVEQDFLTSFGARPFSRLAVGYTVGEKNMTKGLELSYCGARYLGSGRAVLTFSARFCEQGAYICTLAIQSEGGSNVNSAQAHSFYAGDSVDITVLAYVSVGEVGFTFSSAPEPFFEWLFDVEEHTLGVAGMDGNPISGAELTAEKSVGRAILSVELSKAVEIEKMAITCDKGVVLCLDAPYVTVETQVKGSVGGVVEDVEGGLEITEIAGSAVTLSDVTSRSLGKSLAVGNELALVFSPVQGGVRFSSDGSSLAVIGEHSLCLYASRGDGYECVGGLAPHLCERPADVCFCTDGVLVLNGEHVELLDAATGQSLDTRQADFTPTRVFSTDSGVIILAGGSSFSVYDSFSGFTRQSSVSVSGGVYDFDGLTQTLTAVYGGGVRQFRFSGTSYEELSVACTVGEVTSVSGRWGYAVACTHGGFKAINLFEQSVETFAEGGLVTAFQGGNRIAVRTDGGVTVKDVSPLGISTLYEVTGAAVADIGPTGVIAGNAFYPYSLVSVRFELSASGDDCTFTVYKEVPYFAQETHIFTFEAAL